MTTQMNASVTLEQPGDLIAAVPHVLGFHPVDSLVIMGLRGAPTNALGLVLRADLPPPVRPRILAEQLVMPLTEHDTVGATLVVVGPVGLPPDDELPHREVLAECEAALADAGIPVVHQLWAPDTNGGAQWRCYDDPMCSGVVPDPRDTPLAAVAVAAGTVTFARREDIAATLAPEPEDVLARRADLLAEASECGEPAGGTPAAGSERLRFVQSAVDRAERGELNLTDEEVVRLAEALCDHRVRDACLDFGSAEPPDDPAEPDTAGAGALVGLGVSAAASAAEQLWTVLTRGTPTPERAEPATLLAFAAYLRGDGVLAGIALEVAEAADPGHRLAYLLRSALLVGLPPDRLRMAGNNAATQARRDLEEVS